MEGNPLLQTETRERHEQFNALEELDGFKKLTPKQQQMIKLSLYIQQRAVRGTDGGSHDNLGTSDETGDVFISFPREFDENRNPVENKYRTSQKHIYDWYCHAVVTGLEHETVDKNIFYKTDIPKLLDKTGYEITSEADVRDFIEIALDDIEMPAVLHILGNTYVSVLHSAVILGKNDAGEFILWEKKGVSIPYKLTTLKQIFQDYSSHTQEWLVRPFNHLTEDTAD